MENGEAIALFQPKTIDISFNGRRSSRSDETESEGPSHTDGIWIFVSKMPGFLIWVRIAFFNGYRSSRSDEMESEVWHPLGGIRVNVRLVTIHSRNTKTLTFLCSSNQPDS